MSIPYAFKTFCGMRASFRQYSRMPLYHMFLQAYSQQAISFVRMSENDFTKSMTLGLLKIIAPIQRIKPRV